MGTSEPLNCTNGISRPCAFFAASRTWINDKASVAPPLSAAMTIEDAGRGSWKAFFGGCSNDTYAASISRSAAGNGFCGASLYPATTQVAPASSESFATVGRQLAGPLRL